MDYFTLNRRELQALCKKHGIPANLTNVSMAEALTALLNVDDNKPSDDKYQKQQVASEDTGDKSVQTDISDNPRRCTKSKKREVAAEGKSAEEPIVLDDDEALSPLKEIHIKTATKTLKGKGGDRTEKSRSTIRQRKILDKDVDEASDAVTPYISVKARRGRTCKKDTNAKNPKTRTCYATDTDDAKPLQQKYNSCENDEESYGANNGSVEEVTETRPKKVDEVEMATEESIIVSTHTKDAKSQQQEHDSCEKRKENEEPKNGSVEEAPKARPKRGLPRKQVDKSEQTTEERIQVSIDTEDAKTLKPEDDLSENGKGSDEANNGSVKAVPKARPKGRLSRKKVEEMEMATEGSSNQISTNEEDVKPLQQEHESCEQGEGSDEANNGSVGVAKTRANSRLLRKKVDKVEMVTEEGIQESVDANNHSFEVILRPRSKARPSRNRVDKLEEAAEEIIQGTNNAKDGSVKEVHENRHKPIRKKFDAVKEVAEEDNTICANHSVEEGSGTSDTNDESVEIAEATAESVKEVPENMPKGKLSTQKIEEATEENIKWTDNVKDEEISRTKGRSSSRKRSEEAAEENIQVVDDEIKDRSPICRRSTRANALKGLDTQPLIKRSLPRRKYIGEDFVKETPRASKRIKNSSDKIVKYDPAETSVKVSAKKRANKECPKFLDGDSMEGSARKNNKEVSIFTQANQIQNSHDSADVKNVGEAEGNTGAFEGESMHEGVSIAESPNGAALQTCSQEGRAPPSFKDMEGHADSIKEGMDMSERFNVTESKTPGIKDEESLQEGVSIAKCSNGEAPGIKDEVNHGESMPEAVSQATETTCAQEGKAPGIKDEESLQEGVRIAKCSNGTMLETMCAAQEGEAPGIKDEVNHGESMPEAVSQAAETMCAQEGKAPRIKDEVSQGNSIQEGVSRAESPKGIKIETMCDREAESPNETEPETMCAQEGTTSSIREEENQGESVQDSRNTAKHPNGTEPEMVCGQQSESLGIEDEENQGKAVQKTVSIADIIYETEPETMCAQEGKAPGINDEESQGESIQEGRSTAESSDRTESEIMYGQESESPCIKVEESQGKTSHKTVSLSDSNNETEPETMSPQEDKAPSIKDEESQGESMQEHSMSIAECRNGTEPEIVCGKESEYLGINDKENQGKAVQKTVSIADIIYETQPETMCIQEGKAPGIKNEESQGKSIQEGRSTSESPDRTESEIMCGQESESPRIKVEESQGKTSRKTVILSDSNNETEPETMCGQESESPRIKVEESQGKTSSLSDSNNETEPETLSPQEDKAPGIKDEESQGESMQEDSMSIAESPNGTEPEIVCGKENESPGNKDEESKGQTLKPVSIADSNKKTEAENMQSPCSEASGGKDETNLLKPIQQGISIPEGHDQTEVGTMHLEPKVGAKLVFSYSVMERKFQFCNDKSYKELSTGLEDEDVFDDIKVHISEDVSKAVTSVSIGNGKADLVERLSVPSIVNGNQTDVRATLVSSSAQIDSEDQMKKFTSEVVDGKNALYSACVEERIEDSYCHDETGSNKAPLAKEHIHYKEKQFVPDAIKDQKLNDFSDDYCGREEFVPWTPPKEEQHFPVPIDDDQETSHFKLEVLALGMDLQQAFNNDREVEDLGLGNKNSLALQECEQQNTKELEEHQDKTLLDIEDTHFHEITCVPDEQVQVNVDKIQKKISPDLESQSVRKLKAMIKDRKEEDLCLGKNNLFALQGYEQQNTKEFEETLCQDKFHLFYMEDARFHEKTCDPDEQVQVTYVNKQIQKEISPPLTSLSLRKLKAMYKDTMAKKENCDSIHFQEKTCRKDRLTWGNKLKNEIKEENCGSLGEPIVCKENKVGKRPALHNLSSNDLEERQKGPNKAE